MHCDDDDDEIVDSLVIVVIDSFLNVDKAFLRYLAIFFFFYVLLFNVGLGE